MALLPLLLLVLVAERSWGRSMTESHNQLGQGLEAIRQGAFQLHNCGIQSPPPMKRVLFSNRSITCNDGSVAGFYIRRSHGSRRWIIYLEGGWYCFDTQSCNNRWLRMRVLMTSKLWPEVRHAGGILSSDPEENSYWWNANHVLVPYCSSDTWSGAAYPKSKGDFAFLGAEIVQQVIKELVAFDLLQARRIYLAGSSAGGTGVLVNLDRVTDLIRSWGSSVDVRGIADSGWFLDNAPYAPVDCTDSHSCSPVEAIKQGIKLWNGQVPQRCRSKYPFNEAWKCYFGYKSYPTMQAPVFVFQWLFDEAQMTADNVGPPVTKAQWDYIHKMGVEIRATLQNVSAVFAPSCISHIVLTKRDWQNVKVNDVSLPQAIRCWEEQAHEHNIHSLHAHREYYSSFNMSGEMTVLADAPLTSRSRRQNLAGDNSSTPTPRKKKKHRRRNGRKKKKSNNNNNNNNTTTEAPPMRRKNRNERSLFSEDPHAHHRRTMHEDQCHHHMLDECTWPQCNRACPKLHNPFTGEEMDFIDLLKSFGLDMGSVATALGMDLETLHTMSNDHLLQILTQTASRK